MTPIAGERLVLVRHTMPVVDPAVPSPRWELGPEGSAAARALRPLLPRPAYYVASPEPKARQTIEEVAGDVATDQVTLDEGLAEVGRPEAWSDDYRAVARGYLDGIRPAGWESPEDVGTRFDAAIVRHASGAALDAGRRYPRAGADRLAGSPVPARPRPGRVLGGAAVPGSHRGRSGGRYGETVATRVVVLNGGSSSGKSGIVRCL